MRIACGAMMRRISSDRRHPERLAGQHLAAVDAEHAGAQHFGDEGRFVGRERQAGRADRAELQPDLRQRVVGKHHLQDQRRAAEDDGVAPGECGQQPEPAELHRREDQTEHQSADQTEGRHREGEPDARDQVRQTEIVKEQRHQSTVRMSGSLKLFGSRSHFFKQVLVDAGLLNLDQRRHHRIAEFRLVLGHADADRIGDRDRDRLLQFVRIGLHRLVHGVDVVDIGVGAAGQDRLDAVGVVVIELDRRLGLARCLALRRQILHQRHLDDSRYSRPRRRRTATC